MNESENEREQERERLMPFECYPPHGIFSPSLVSHFPLPSPSGQGLPWQSSGQDLTFQCSRGGAGSIPGRGAKILHASQSENQNKINIVTNSIDFKNCPHEKKILKKFFQVALSSFFQHFQQDRVSKRKSGPQRPDSAFVWPQGPGEPPLKWKPTSDK